MLQKIDSITIHVRDAAEASDFYSEVFGLQPLWKDDQNASAGLTFPDRNSEVILYSDTVRPGEIEVNYLVEDVISAIQKYIDQGCTLAVEPFDVNMGKCAVIQDPFGIRLCIIDKSNAATDPSLS